MSVQKPLSCTATSISERSRRAVPLRLKPVWSHLSSTRPYKPHLRPRPAKKCLPLAPLAALTFHLLGQNIIFPVVKLFPLTPAGGKKLFFSKWKSLLALGRPTQRPACNGSPPPAPATSRRCGTVLARTRGFGGRVVGGGGSCLKLHTLLSLVREIKQ